MTPHPAVQAHIAGMNAETVATLAREMREALEQRQVKVIHLARRRISAGPVEQDRARIQGEVQAELEEIQQIDLNRARLTQEAGGIVSADVAPYGRAPVYLAPPPISCHRVVRWFPEEDSGVMDVHPTPMEGPFGIHFETMVRERLSMVQAEVDSYDIVEEVAGMTEPLYAMRQDAVNGRTWWRMQLDRIVAKKQQGGGLLLVGPFSIEVMTISKQRAAVLARQLRELQAQRFELVRGLTVQRVWTTDLMGKGKDRQQNQQKEDLRHDRNHLALFL